MENPAIKPDIAHISISGDKIQTVKEHCDNTAALCRTYSVPATQDIMQAIGELHDVGKYQITFQKRINGDPVKIEHSICGAKVAKELYPTPLALLMEYCISGHHSGIPDGGAIGDTADKSTLYGRITRETEDYSKYKTELSLPDIDFHSYLNFLKSGCVTSFDASDKFAFITRYCFSCLTDADSVDTAEFCTGQKRDTLSTDFNACLDKLEKRFANFKCITELQKARSEIQAQVYAKASDKSEIFLMNMPTGSGKTLCSIKFALMRALKQHKKRIIYIIPFNSIIDQTADTFSNIFGDSADILRHQSTFSFDDNEKARNDEDYRMQLKFATENWDAELIITTAVQFFESVYSNRRGKLRKLHNMADSVLIFDEAHLMPQEYLQPCLRAICYITRYLGSEAVFLTATMPDYQKLIAEYALPDSRVCELVKDKTLFSAFKKCSYKSFGVISDAKLLEIAANQPSSLIVVNRRATAKRLYSLCSGEKYHLSTYMTPFDRKRIIDRIHERLTALEHDFKNPADIPPDRHITVISTSLIEAGVDLDFHSAFRELTGLDSILQTGGRCNREGKRKGAVVGIFELETESKKEYIDERPEITKGIISEFEDIQSPDSINAYYERLYFIKKDEIVSHSMNNCKSIDSIPFKTYAEHFELMKQNTVSVAVAQDECSRKLIDTIKISGMANARLLQKYSFSVYRYEFDDLLQQHVVNDYGSGVYCLTNPQYYDAGTGVKFEGDDIYF